MCIYDEMSAFQPSVNTMPEQYEVRFCKADSSVSAETFSNKVSNRNFPPPFQPQVSQLTYCFDPFF